MIRNAGPWSAIHDVKCVAKEYTRTANAKELFSFTQLLQGLLLLREATIRFDVKLAWPGQFVVDQCRRPGQVLLINPRALSLASVFTPTL